MADSKKKKLGVNQVLAVQVVVSFVVIAVLIVVGGLLIFRVMGAEYTQFTVAGFIATVYMAFITFQPAGTLFAARKELIEGKVELPTGGDAGADRPVGTLAHDSSCIVSHRLVMHGDHHGYHLWNRVDIAPPHNLNALVALCHTALPHYQPIHRT